MGISGALDPLQACPDILNGRADSMGFGGGMHYLSFLILTQTHCRRIEAAPTPYQSVHTITTVVHLQRVKVVYVVLVYDIDHN